MAHTDVKVNIDLLKPVGTLGFGFPLILAKVSEKPVAYTECKDLDEVVKAGFDEKSDVYKAANLMLMQNNAPSKFAVCSVTEEIVTVLPSLIGKGWRQLIVVGFVKSGDMKDEEISAYIETTDKMYFTCTNAVSSASQLKSFNKTVCFEYKSEDYGELAVAALVGATAGYNAGEITYKNIILKGLTAQTYTSAKLTALHENGGITVLEKAGDNVTSEGIVGSGEYIDIIDSKDWIVQQLTYQTQKTLNTMKKVPYDNNGIAMLESIAVNVMRTAYNNGMIATAEDGSPAYTVDYSLVSDCSPSDIAARKYIGGKFAFTLAGAVHSVEINGEISIA